MTDGRRVGLVLDRCFEGHDTGAGHPEQAARLAHIRRLLDTSGLSGRCRLIDPVLADDELLALVHDRAHIARVEDACATGQQVLDAMDNSLCPVTARVARQAAGSLVALCGDVLDGRLERGFAAVRPPGHHAERDLAMGFCYFNNVAVAARWLVEVRGLKRVMVVDWDVHHGNGTQHIFESDPTVFFFSVHQSPLYPGTGMRDERGRGAGQGTTLNCPLAPGAGDDEFLAVLHDALTASAEQFKPEFILISAGFDAHIEDPLGSLRVSTGAFARATQLVCDLAERYAAGRLVSVLEGGYDLDALAQTVSTHLEVLLN
jgi:acetoin utilization deacetylase AcuC-like enzyme